MRYEKAIQKSIFQNLALLKQLQEAANHFVRFMNMSLILKIARGSGATNQNGGDNNIRYSTFLGLLCFLDSLLFLVKVCLYSLHNNYTVLRFCT